MGAISAALESLQLIRLAGHRVARAAEVGSESEKLLVVAIWCQALRGMLRDFREHYPNHDLDDDLIDLLLRDEEGEEQ